jgi:hypothetical protein
MPVGVTDSNNFLGWLFAKNSMNNKNKVYIGLSSNDPEADGGVFNELSGDGYARELISQYGESYPNKIGSPSNRKITNTAQINFTKFTAQKIAKGIGFFTAETGGTPYMYFKLSNSGGTLTIPAGAVALFDPNTFVLALGDTDEELTT